MSESQAALNEEALKSLFLYADTKIEGSRISGHAARYVPLLEISRSELFRPLGETPPAIAFNADWE